MKLLYPLSLSVILTSQLGCVATPPIPEPPPSLTYANLIEGELRTIAFVCKPETRIVIRTYSIEVENVRIILRRDIACVSMNGEQALLIVCNHQKGECLIVPTRRPPEELNRVILEAAPTVGEVI